MKNLLEKAKQIITVFRAKRAKNKQKKALLKALTTKDVAFDDLINFVSILSYYGFDTNKKNAPYSIIINATGYGKLQIGNDHVFKAFTITAYNNGMKISVILDVKTDDNDHKKTITIGEARYSEKDNIRDRGRNIFFREFVFHDSISINNLETIMITPTVIDQVNDTKNLLRDAFRFIINDLIKWS